MAWRRGKVRIRDSDFGISTQLQLHVNSDVHFQINRPTPTLQRVALMDPGGVARHNIMPWACVYTVLV